MQEGRHEDIVSLQASSRDCLDHLAHSSQGDRREDSEARCLFPHLPHHRQMQVLPYWSGGILDSLFGTEGYI